MEGTILEVCEGCSKFGELVETRPVRMPKVRRTPKLKEETIIIDNYGKKIIEARKKINLTREGFAKKINEKESLIRRIESEVMRPNDKLIEKIERFLNIKLKTAYEKKKFQIKPRKGRLTIGDVLEVE